jgi:hypothetical protein
MSVQNEKSATNVDIEAKEASFEAAKVEGYAAAAIDSVYFVMPSRHL